MITNCDKCLTVLIERENARSEKNQGEDWWGGGCSTFRWSVLEEERMKDEKRLMLTSNADRGQTHRAPQAKPQQGLQPLANKEIAAIKEL